MYVLYIANKNYSSWSLRPWALLRELGIPFEERLLRFGDRGRWEEFRVLNPSGRVPFFIDGALGVADSLAIVEYLAEAHPGVWPADAAARAWARSAAAQMHAGFAELRSRCSMTCGVRVRLHDVPAALDDELTRLEGLWNEGLRRFGGPYLGGAAFTAVDAFFAPVALRLQTYGLRVGAPAAAYAQRLLELASLREWYAAALAEPFRDEPHERDMRDAGSVLEDLRAAVV